MENIYYIRPMTNFAPILNKIKNRGGLDGASAPYYTNDDVKGPPFIQEGKEQGHNRKALEFCGEALVIEIISYHHANILKTFNDGS